MEHSFKEKVIAVVQGIPPGKVMSYGQVAAACGSPRSAREVGWVLNGFDGDENFPWWRVVNKQGRISIKGTFVSTAKVQKEKLQKDGVIVGDDFSLEIGKYLYVNS